MQDIGFNDIDPCVLIGKVFLDDTGEFPVCERGGVLPVVTGQHFIFKPILVRFDLSDNGRNQNTIL